MSFALAPLDGRIELRALLGRGGMGEVHRAWDRALERAVAVKLVRGSDPREAERLLLEARLQARVDHPHVVKVHEVGTLGGRPCIVLRLVEGRALSEVAGSHPLEERVELVRQAALGLHAAHLQGLVHRDVKPGNVLVEEEPAGIRTALVSDFGLARAEEGGLTRTGLPAGTLDFMSPEQILGAGPVDFRSDVWALGATLYAVVAGAPPFRASAPGRADDGGLLRRILEEDPAALREAAPGAPRELGIVAARAMEKEPAARYASAEAFAEDLARFQRGEPLRARPASAAERVAKWSRRNRLAARALAVAAAALVAFGVFAAWTSRRAGLASLEAARMGAEAQRMENLVRVEHLLPPHDLRPAHARVRARIEALRAARGGAGDAARAFAIGRGHQLLGELDEARAELLRAWEGGFRGGGAARAIGELEARIYSRELARMPRIDDPARKQAYVERLREAHRDPALARLRSVVADSPADERLLAARMAIVEERFEEAARAAKDARAAGGGLEAATLEGEARTRAAKAAFERRDFEATFAALAAAEAVLAEAIAIGRSAPEPRLLLARARLLGVTARTNSRGPSLDGFDGLSAALDDAAALQPDDAELEIARSEMETQRGRILNQLGRDPEPALVAAIRHAERAAAAAPRSPEPFEQFAWAALNHARTFQHGTKEVLWAWEKGIAAASRARALAPGSSRPASLLAQMHADRAEYLEIRGRDGLADARAALESARAVVASGDRPVAGRLLAAAATRQVALLGWSRGEDAAAGFAEAIALVTEAAALAPQERIAAGYGVNVAFAACTVALAEGRVDREALEAGMAWAERLLEDPEDLTAAAQAGEMLLLRGRAGALEGADPEPWLARAEGLLARVAAARDVYPPAVLRLAEAALVRADAARSRGESPVPDLRRAAGLARRMQAIDPGDFEAWQAEARALLEEPGAPGRAERLARAAVAAARAVDLNGRDPEGWALAGRIQLERGDLEGARGALERAEALQPRLASARRLRAALGQDGAGGAPRGGAGTTTPAGAR